MMMPFSLRKLWTLNQSMVECQYSSEHERSLTLVGKLITHGRSLSTLADSFPPPTEPTRNPTTRRANRIGTNPLGLDEPQPTAGLNSSTNAEDPPFLAGLGGSGGEARTHDPLINSQLLCQLSYPGRRPSG